MDLLVLNIMNWSFLCRHITLNDLMITAVRNLLISIKKMDPIKYFGSPNTSNYTFNKSGFSDLQLLDALEFCPYQVTHHSLLNDGIRIIDK